MNERNDDIGYALAFDTSTAQGGVALGRGAEILGVNQSDMRDMVASWEFAA